MALIKCKECGQQMSSSAKVCPHCGKQRSSAVKTGFAWIILLFGAAVIWGIWKGSSEPSSTPPPPLAVASPPVPAAPQQHTPPLAVASAPPPAAPQPKPSLPSASWIYQPSSDSMTGKSIRRASVESQNTVDFSFPYAGPQHATLTLRKHPRYGTDVIFSIERGQFGCGFDGCTILVRFDDGSAKRYTGTEPDDHSTTAVFIYSATRFMTQLRKAKVVRVESSFYQEGRQVFTFDVAGFDDKMFSGQ